jgi:hypothetical protein
LTAARAQKERSDPKFIHAIGYEVRLLANPSQLPLRTSPMSYCARPERVSIFAKRQRQSQFLNIGVEHEWSVSTKSAVFSKLREPGILAIGMLLP